MSRIVSRVTLIIQPKLIAAAEVLERHGIEYLHTSTRVQGKRRVVELDTPESTLSPSPPKAPRRASSFDDKLRSSSSPKELKLEKKSPAKSPQVPTPEPEMVDLSDTTEDEL